MQTVISNGFMNLTGQKLYDIIKGHLSTNYLELNSERLNELVDILLDIFDIDWCERNAQDYGVKWHKEFHPFMDHTVSTNGKGMVLGLCRAFSLAIDSNPLILTNPNLVNRLRNSSQFKSSLFELAILANLANQGIELIDLDHSTKKGDVEALGKLGDEEFLIECKILDESDLSEEIDELMEWGIPEPANGEVIFKDHPDQEDFDKIKELFRITIEDKLAQNYENKKIKVKTNVSDQSKTSYTLGFDDTNRQKNTLRKALKKADKNRKVWLFCGVFPDSRQGDAIDGFNELLVEKRYAKKVHELSVILIRHSMEYIHMGHHSLVKGNTGELKTIITDNIG